MVKRLVTVIGIAYLWFALGFSTYAQGNEISQISVKMPEVWKKKILHIIFF